MKKKKTKLFLSLQVNTKEMILLLPNERKGNSSSFSIRKETKIILSFSK